MNTKIIRRYGKSRALYDADNKKIIRQKNLPEIVLNENVIIYNDEGKDITLTILLTMLASEEFNKNYKSILSEKMLMDIIRYSQNELSSFINIFLEKNLEFFSEYNSVFDKIIQEKGGEELFKLLNNFIKAQKELLENYK